jgi:chloramphenicol-sensitive protein RarD
MGLLQYVTPTLQFVLAVVAYGEPLSRAHVVAFALIWTALGLSSAGAVWRMVARPSLSAGSR